MKKTEIKKPARRPRGTVTVMMSLRVQPETPALLAKLAEKCGTSKSAALDEAVARYARQQRVKV